MKLYLTEREAMIRRINELGEAWKLAIKRRDTNLIDTYSQHYKYLLIRLDNM
jgi:hypothetical protein